MKDAAGFVLIVILLFIFLAMRYFYKFWFGSTDNKPAKKLPHTPTAEQSPSQINIQNNYNTVNILVVKEQEPK